MSKNYFLAFDLGASSGRAMLGTLENQRLKLTEVHRFKNQMTNIHNSYFWNIYSLFGELKTGLYKCINELNIYPQSIGIDTWGVDYGLISSSGQLIGIPFAYRDHRTDKSMGQFFKKFSKKETYQLSGIQFMQFNTLFQLFSAVNENSPEFSIAKKLLFTPDLINYFFTGVMKNEYTIASTSQLLKPGKPEWEQNLINAAGVSDNLFGEIIQPGSVLGDVLPEIQNETGCRKIPCVAVASHDTASAVVSVPAEINENWAFLSSGTWSLLGIESSKPLVSEKAMNMSFTNEGGVDGTTRFLKNIMGMWLIQECKRIWDQEKMLSWQDIVDLSNNEKQFKCFINPDDPMFLNPENMPMAIKQFCEKTNQPIPENKGQIARCIYDSLALKYKYSVEQIEEITGKKIDKLHIIGGGANNKMLNQLTANAIGVPVVAGPTEATAIGNIMMQAKALCMVDSLQEIREIIRNSVDVKIYNPDNDKNWKNAFEKFKKLM